MGDAARQTYSGVAASVPRVRSVGEYRCERCGGEVCDVDADVRAYAEVLYDGCAPPPFSHFQAQFPILLCTHYWHDSRIPSPLVCIAADEQGRSVGLQRLGCDRVVGANRLPRVFAPLASAAIREFD